MQTNYSVLFEKSFLIMFLIMLSFLSNFRLFRGDQARTRFYEGNPLLEGTIWSHIGMPLVIASVVPLCLKIGKAPVDSFLQELRSISGMSFSQFLKGYRKQADPNFSNVLPT